MHDAACSVLLAYPADNGPWRPRKIVVGFDGSTYALAALRSAEELADALGGTVEVVTATGGKAIERDAAWTERVRDLGSRASGRRPRRALAHRRSRRRRLTRRPRHPHDRQRQRAHRTPGSLHGPRRARGAGEQQHLRRRPVGAPARQGGTWRLGRRSAGLRGTFRAPPNHIYSGGTPYRWRLRCWTIRT